ncbi:hypothetical protein SLS60_004188 [Paraconiothyrium brasiliense]|uniref:PHD-type domain-containing protein n=1 Tax=Paraconiothyrium brasiliense TaxID=300254 RepID=A0ABR3RQU5_9PLEO
MPSSQSAAPQFSQSNLSMPSQDVQQPVANSPSSSDPSLFLQAPPPPQYGAAFMPNFGPNPEGTRKSSAVPSHKLPPSRSGVYLQQLANNAVTHTEFLRDYSSHQEAWAYAMAFANSKKAELEEEMKLAGNSYPNLDILPDTVQCNFTITVDHMFRWRVQVNPKENNTSVDINELQHSEKQPSARGPQSERQDTPAQIDSTKEVMKTKQELGQSPSASLANYSTSSPHVDDLQFGGDQATVDQNGLDQGPIHMPETSTWSPDHDGDTVADDDSLVGDITNHFEDVVGAALPGTVLEEALSVEPNTAGAEGDNQGASLLAGTKKPAVTEGLDSDAATPEDEKIDTGAPAAAKPQMTTVPAYFGLYVTSSKPPAPAVTYRLQVNTSLGQAESDMKLIASNELTKALSQGTEDDLHLDIEKSKIDLVNLVNGFRLCYEIFKGNFAEGKFQSEMELSGRVVDGESYTKRMFEEASAKHELIDVDAMSEAPIAANEQDELVETLGDGSKAIPSRKRTKSADTNLVSDIASEQPDSDHDTAVAPSSKKRKVESPRAGRIESHDKSTDRQQPTPIALRAPIKKRGREPQEPTLALAGPPAKKARGGSHEDAEGEVDDEIAGAHNATESPTEEVDDSNALYCRCKQPDNDGRQLIGCDGEQCPNNQWVHLECVPEVMEPPKDEGEEGVEKWYCPDCDPAAFQHVEENEYEMKKKVGKKRVATSEKGVAASKKTAEKKGGAGVQKTGGKKGGSAANRRKLIR